MRKEPVMLQVRTAAWHQNDQLLLTAYIDQPGIRHAAAMAVKVNFTTSVFAKIKQP